MCDGMEMVEVGGKDWEGIESEKTSVDVGQRGCGQCRGEMVGGKNKRGHRESRRNKVCEGEGGGKDIHICVG